uniref:Uncharacterized protein n=1 Tax=Trichogramma kaykai TaxID=54128 RepID=A0ABD2XGE2_9HYME
MQCLYLFTVLTQGFRRLAVSFHSSGEFEEIERKCVNERAHIIGFSAMIGISSRESAIHTAPCMCAAGAVPAATATAVVMVAVSPQRWKRSLPEDIIPDQGSSSNSRLAPEDNRN